MRLKQGRTYSVSNAQSKKQIKPHSEECRAAAQLGLHVGSIEELVVERVDVWMRVCVCTCVPPLIRGQDLQEASSGNDPHYRAI